LPASPSVITEQEIIEINMEISGQVKLDLLGGTAFVEDLSSGY
jgi:hypothetical protein